LSSLVLHFSNPIQSVGHAVAQLVEALLCRPEGRRFIPDGVTGIFHLHYPSGCTMAWSRFSF